MKTFAEYVKEYKISAAKNDQIWDEFNSLTNSVAFLKLHRDWVEQNSWGFGDRAFHYMWYLLLRHKVHANVTPRFLEIGVYKGQIISLWSLIAERERVDPEIYAISPLSGKPKLPAILHRIWYVLNSNYREDARSGNLYSQEQYLAAVHRIFSQFDLDFGKVRLLKGYSQDDQVRLELRNMDFDLVYVDGGHTYEEVTQDILVYGNLVRVGGHLLLDDASFFQPGTVFWKGHESVSRAAEEIDSRKFINVLNVGHNRIYERVG